MWMPELNLLADYELLQGFCFPEPAWRMSPWIGRDRNNLNRLYSMRKDYDAYLW